MCTVTGGVTKGQVVYITGTAKAPLAAGRFPRDHPNDRTRHATLYKANRLFSVFSSRSIRFLDGGGAGGMAGPPMDTGAGAGGPGGPEVADAAGGRRSAAAARSARNRSNSAGFGVPAKQHMNRRK